MSDFAFKPSNEITFHTVEANRRNLFEYCRHLKSTNVLVNLSDVQHCDSAGLAFLIEAKRLAKQQGKDCQINNMGQSILALAEFCGVDGILGAVRA